MLAFLFAIGLFGVLIAFGVCVSVYLYNSGVIGNRRLRRARRMRAIAVEAASEDDGEEQGYMDINPTDDSTTRLARVSLIVFLGCFVVLIMLVSTFINGAFH
jgi:hypothetical protein